MIKMILAIDLEGGIGKDGKLPWYIPLDLKRFKSVTMGKTILMGRKTWESLPMRPLPGRENLVISRQVGEGLINDIDKFVIDNKDKEVFLIGGAEIYKYFLEKGYVDEIYLTFVIGSFSCDSSIDLKLLNNFHLIEGVDDCQCGNTIENQDGTNFIFVTLGKNEN